LLKPTLSNVYERISGKTESHVKIFVSKAVVCDLNWSVSKCSDGVFLFNDVNWDVQHADVTVYTDACLSGLSFFFQNSRKGFQSPVPHDPPKNTIYFEALAVVSAVDAVMCMMSVLACLLIFSDNSNTVDFFHSLQCQPPYNDLLKFTVSLILKHGILLRVLHVPGVDNDVADHLSQFENM
jgi:hypothetical protein